MDSTSEARSGLPLDLFGKERMLRTAASLPQMGVFLPTIIRLSGGVGLDSSINLTDYPGFTDYVARNSPTPLIVIL